MEHGSDPVAGTLTFAFSRSENDSETIKHFAGAKVDGKELGSNDFPL